MSLPRYLNETYYKPRLKLFKQAFHDGLYDLFFKRSSAILERYYMFNISRFASEGHRNYLKESILFEVYYHHAKRFPESVFEYNYKYPYPVPGKKYELLIINSIQIKDCKVEFDFKFTERGVWYEEIKLLKSKKIFRYNDFYVYCRDKRECFFIKNEYRISRILKKWKKACNIKTKVYNSRFFPESLKLLIFEKDGYRCKCCGKHKDKLTKKQHLEVDHIVAWADGGKTTYKNGQTLCSSCNKAKHHIKRYVKELSI